MFAHAHDITDADAREDSSGSLRASKRFEKVWPSLRRTQARKNHVFDCIPRSLGWFISGDADSDSLSAYMKTFSEIDLAQAQIRLQMYKIVVTDLIETLIFPIAAYPRTLEWILIVTQSCATP